jgi:20S proteasome alpha/beta subunit
MERIENTILSIYGFTSFDDWHNKQRLLQDTTNEMILHDLNHYDLGISLLIAGIDDETISHIYTVEEPGICHSYDGLGFCCAGSGQDHAESVFAMFKYSQSMNKEVVLQLSYIAKKRAELATGIGPTTDAWIIDTSGLSRVLPETMEKLEKMYRQQNIFINSLSDELDIKTESIERDEC